MRIDLPPSLVWNADSRYWQPDSAPSIDYSEGAAVEHRLLEVLRSASDISAFNASLAEGESSWELRYHLHPDRGNLIADLDLADGASILEIGAGCGAITRVLGEATTGEVVALEGATGRARICSERVRDLDNVRVVASPLGEVEFGPIFDVVVVVGVLEYASKFITGPGDPHDEFIRLCASQLKPTGSMVVAIENQLGAKYLAGGREDHTGRPFDGLEGYPNSTTSARTFGLQVLKGRLRREFACVEALLAYPDYKLPKLIVREEFAKAHNLAELISSTLGRPTDRRVASEALLTRTFAANGLTAETANSFVMLAHRSEGVRNAAFPPQGILYGNRYVDRPARLTVFERNDPNVRVFSRKRLSPPEGKFPDSGLLRWQAHKADWIDGVSTAEGMLKAARLGAGVEVIAGVGSHWGDALKQVCVEDLLPGDFFDATWSNFVEAEVSGFIDLEWVAVNPIPPSLPLFRSIETLTRSLRAENVGSPLLSRPVRSLRTQFGDALEIEVLEEHHELYAEYVAELNFIVAGTDKLTSARQLRRQFQSGRLAVLWANSANTRHQLASDADRVRRKASYLARRIAPGRD